MNRSADDKRVDELRDLAGVSEESDRTKKREEWQESGTDDPAFFIKPSEGE